MDEILFVDVREPSEFDFSHIEGAINIPSKSLMDGALELKDVPKDKKIVVYCRSGSRSKMAIDLFQEMGFTNLTNGITQNMVSMSYGVKIIS